MGEHIEGRVLRLDAKVCHVDLGDRVVLAAPRGALFENLEGVKNPIKNEHFKEKCSVI